MNGGAVILLGAVIPDTPSELIELAELLDAHRRFVLGLRGVAWPTLEQEVENRALVAATLACVRRRGPRALVQEIAGARGQ